MKRLLVLGISVALSVLVVSAVASADEHPPLPPHPHILLIDADVEFDPVAEELIVHSVRDCVDIANNRTLRLNAHHQHFHFGTAGDALRSMTGNFPLPTSPFPEVPWTDCDSFMAIFG